jgi:protein TonB
VARRADIVTTVVAVAVHAAAALAVAHQRPRTVAVRPRPVEVEFRRPAPGEPPPQPQAVAPRPAPAPRAPRPIARKVAISPAPRPTPPAPSDPPPRRAAPLPPVYGFAMESPTDASSAIAAARGGTGVADPGVRGGAARGAPSSATRGEPGAGGELAIKTMPEVDADACGRSIAYPPDAERAGIEGKVRLRVALDARGRVSSARVLRGLGHGLDEAAVEALTHRCRFTPAIANDGRAVAFVIESYNFVFELPR